MTAAVIHSYHMALRDLRAFVRQPFYLVATLVQPVIWLLLFGKLFAPLMETTHTTDSYIGFLTPGVVAMTALFASGWSGMVFVVEMEQGTLNRLLVTPVRRGALITGRVIHQALSVTLQSLIILAIALATGARFRGGPLIMLVFLACVALITVAFASLSNALGLLTRSQESVISIAQFLVLPLAFLSATFVPRRVMPGWMDAVAGGNPVNWLVEIGRETLYDGVDWGFVLARAAGLLVVALVCAWLSTLAFRAYQKQV
ncbi:transport permease protein [Actinomadura rubrobrunea]|uniref:Transport permease protein n=1 Tax=Actinomadura rubrobrunea TaxID=115335 RepID=A0A9W6PVS8_9ACTN|nr:ABC transporter permease [Actinomadura rubrobrunea]GLW63906.1 transport permease protein [Actinomadura rubrobrunea]